MRPADRAHVLALAGVRGYSATSIDPSTCDESCVGKMFPLDMSQPNPDVLPPADFNSITACRCMFVPPLPPNGDPMSMTLPPVATRALEQVLCNPAPLGNLEVVNQFGTIRQISSPLA